MPNTPTAQSTSYGVSSFQLPGYPLIAGPFTHLVAERDRLAALRWQHFDVRRVGVTLGAQIDGVDLTRDQPAEVIAELRRALHEYKVIFFRDQPLTAAQHVTFAARFGTLEVHPFIPSNTEQPELVRFEKTPTVAGVENIWHHDVTWRPRPSMGAILHAVAVPEFGGDTLFSDMYAAYEALDAETRTRIDDLTATHDYTRAFGRGQSPEVRERMRAQHPAVSHPVVCTHEATGRRHLYVNRIFVDHIDGLSAADSHDLLDRLCRQADYPEHQVRLHWEPDTVAFWDNRAVQHYAASDYWPQARVMERASIVGNRPAR
ncbi:taurine dioxygenase TauD-like protein [Nocardia nova SH22a]|uniref:Taurine dioxygenase TauD-like protein n=1 Tax=Nocardia nova SH22a TaxID=1415166 RepID=W5TJH6_9NOCA|nr:TauD/TfdA family dioxygenase [Nocardia nova]AHH19334.1 taurine dioxygenase TauD-like protein [Nocardia nova SH22a]